MYRLGTLLLAFCLLTAPALPRQDSSICGTHREKSREELFLHRQSMRRLARAPRPEAALQAGTTPSAARDIGNIAIIEDSDGVVARQNQFNLDSKTVRFTPSNGGATQYRYAVADSAYDGAAASAGTPLNGLDDDDTRAAAIPFTFPFFGSTYNQVFVNSDGNLTFNTGDKESSDRSLGRMTSGPPRIAPLFDDLDPSTVPGGVRVLADTSRFVVSWVGVPEYAQYGTGLRQTFQAALYPDGRIEFSYSGAAPSAAVAGIAPGNLQGTTALVSFRNDPSGDYTGPVAERFGDTLAVDMVSAAQKFFQTHEDAYDYLVVFNNMGIGAGPTAVAYENTVRNINRSGYGDTNLDYGREYGSLSRLQAVLNLGPLNQYPSDPAALVKARSASGDTPITIIAHETGHLFLAYASVRDPNDPSARPMLGAQLAHWSFLFNSEASLLEGERIRDDGPGANPRFTTTDTVQAYAPLDQYLMGFRTPSEVPPSFYVTGPPAYLAQQHPLRGSTFNGDRVDVAVDDVIRAMGPRIPDSTVAQRRFRFAFILVVPQGTDLKADELTQLETYRSQFEQFYAAAASNRASADATMKRSLKLSLFPAAGVPAGGAGSASLTVESAPASNLAINLQAQNGNASLPASVTIPAGAKSASFTFNGVRAGVEDVTAVPADSTYETAFARVQVAAASTLLLEAVSGDRQIASGAGPLPDPIVVRVTDANRLPYPGLRLQAAPSTGGSVNAVSAVTDASGQASFRWTPGPASANQLRITVDPAPALGLTINAGAAVPVVTAVVNGASRVSGLAPGTIGSVTGVNFGGATSVQLNGRSLPLLNASDRQIDFYIPPDVPTGAATLTVQPPSGAAATARVTLGELAPGIFFDAATGFGAVLPSGSADTTDTHPVAANDYIEIYCTGLGPTRTSGGYQLTLYQPAVYIGGIASVVTFSGLTAVPGYYQVNAQVPFGIGGGVQPLVIRIGDGSSNQVNIRVQ